MKTMKRKDFKTVVRCFSYWKIDKRKGDYKLPSGCRLSHYLEDLVFDLLKKHNLAIRSDGNVGTILNGKIFVAFGDDQVIPDQERAVSKLVCEMIY